MDRKLYMELEYAEELRNLKSDYEITMEQRRIDRMLAQEEVRRLKSMVGKCGGCGTYGELKRDKKAMQFLVMCPYCGRSSQGAKTIDTAIGQWNTEQASYRTEREADLNAASS